VGVGPLPAHMVQRLSKSGEPLEILEEGEPLKNSISLGYLRERTQSRTAQALANALLQGVAQSEEGS